MASDSNLPKDNSLSELRTQIANDSTLATAVTIDQVKGVIYSVQIGAFSKPLLKENKIILNDLEIIIEFNGFNIILIDDYQLSEGFNNTKSAYMITVRFDQKLTTTISI